MIRINGEIPNEVWVACSGGPDSMAVVDFLRSGGRKISLAHVHHGTKHANDALKIVKEYSDKYNLQIVVDYIGGTKKSHESSEMFWHHQRRRFFDDLFRMSGKKVITCHHLDDQVENWVMTSMRGIPKLIPSAFGPVIRPFLSTRKSDLIGWCERKNVNFTVDPTNFETKCPRNLVRNKVIPLALEVNPGIHKTVMKMMRERK